MTSSTIEPDQAVILTASEPEGAEGPGLNLIYLTITFEDSN